MEELELELEPRHRRGLRCRLAALTESSNQLFVHLAKSPASFQLTDVPGWASAPDLRASSPLFQVPSTVLLTRLRMGKTRSMVNSLAGRKTTGGLESWTSGTDISGHIRRSNRQTMEGGRFSSTLFAWPGGWQVKESVG